MKLRMKKVFLVSLLALYTFFICLSQNKNSSAKIEIIKVKKNNIENEIKNGSLSFLKGCFWTETIHIKTKIISTTRANPNELIGRRGIIYIEKIKKKNPDGSFTNLPSKQIVIE